MDNKKQRSKSIAKTLLMVVILIVIAVLNKVNPSIKQENRKELTFQPCQVCDDVEPLDYETILANERLQHQLENKKAVHERRERERLLAERLKEERDRRNDELKKETKKQVVSRGTSYKGQWQTFEMTSYIAMCYKCSGIGKAGVDLRDSIYYDGMRVIAVDPNVIPLWSIVEIEMGNEVFKAIALDTGGRIKHKIVDLLVETEDKAYENGRQTIKLRMIRRGKGRE